MQNKPPQAIAADEADRRVGRNWFDRFTRNVVCFADDIQLDGDFDTLQRAEIKGEVECLLFEGDLRVEGRMRFQSDVQSILVVLGDLHAHAIELGDAMVAVAGTVYARDYVFAPPNEGVLEVGPGVRSPATDEWVALPDVSCINAPIFGFFDFDQKRHRLFYPSSNGAGGVIELEESEWIGRLDPELFGPSGLKHEPALERLRQGRDLTEE